ncbi:MAG: hypothetical protein VXZ82_05875 [Planctomycetota bacterium]|nr:hypothetical protein [Planctomycetota bacterium]
MSSRRMGSSLVCQPQTIPWALIALRGIGSEESLEAMAELSGRHPNEGLQAMAERLLNP